MIWKPLDKFDSNLYKGVAILMIVAHNFMKHFPAPKGNEFLFHPERFSDLLNILLNEPENVIRVSLSFFGHFGVQVFIFLSAYGLTKKYSSQNLIFSQFFLRRIFKIYPTFLLAVFAWLLIVGWVTGGLGAAGPLKLLDMHIEGLMFKFIFFIPRLPFSPVGPWWFIPFIFQFYFIFPFLLKLFYSRGSSILFFISVVSILISMKLQGGIGDINFYYTIFGHLPEVCLGIYLAKKDGAGLPFPLILIFASLIIYFLGNLYEIFWYVSHISFLAILLAVFSYIIPIIRAKIQVLNPFFLLEAYLCHCFWFMVF